VRNGKGPTNRYGILDRQEGAAPNHGNQHQQRFIYANDEMAMPSAKPLLQLVLLSLRLLRQRALPSPLEYSSTQRLPLSTLLPFKGVKGFRSIDTFIDRCYIKQNQNSYEYQDLHLT